MTALSPEQRQRHAALSRQLAQATAEVKELPDGYAFRYETDERTWTTAAEYVDLERRCCPFFAFALERESGSGQVRTKVVATVSHGRSYPITAARQGAGVLGSSERSRFRSFDRLSCRLPCAAERPSVTPPEERQALRDRTDSLDESMLSFWKHEPPPSLAR